MCLHRRRCLEKLAQERVESAVEWLTGYVWNGSNFAFLDQFEGFIRDEGAVDSGQEREP
jgi:hypothetical protein